jgi:hypothetical protein
MVMEIGIADDVARVRRRMTDIERRELPFALALALSGTAFDVRTLMIERVGPESFELRDARFLRAAIRVRKATKRDLTARVYDHLGSSDLELHARGGVRYPVDGRHVAVPTRVLTPRRRARGVPRAWRPRQVLRKPRVFRTRIGGREYIVRRRTRRRYPVEPLYLLVERARMRRRFSFYEAAEREFRARIGGQFRRAMRRAVGPSVH